MHLSGQRDTRANYHLPQGVKVPAQGKNSGNAHQTQTASEQKKQSKIDGEIVCKRLNEEPVKIMKEGDRKNFVPLALVIENKKKALKEQPDLISKPVSESRPTPELVLASGQLVHSNSKGHLPPKSKNLKGSHSQLSFDASNDEDAYQLLEKKCLNQQQPGRRNSKIPLYPTQNQNLPPSKKSQEVKRRDGSRSREPSRPTLMDQGPIKNHIVPVRNKSSPPKTRKSKSIEKKPKKNEQEKENKPHVSAEFDQMIKNNAKRILEEKRRQKEEEQMQREMALNKKHRVFEEDQKIRELNKQSVQPERSKKNSLPWGADQRKFQQQFHGSRVNMENNGEFEAFEEKKRYHQLDERERRERIGLGHLEENVVKQLRDRSRAKKSEDVKHVRDESSAERVQQQKPKLTKEQEQKIKEFMEIQRQRMEQMSRMQKETKEQERQRIRENLNKLLEEQKAQVKKERKERKRATPEPNGLEQLSKQKQKKKGKKLSRKNLVLDDLSSKKNNFPDYNIPQQDLNSVQVSLSLREGDDDQNYSLLYSEYRKIINEKQLLSSQQQDVSRLSGGDFSHSHHSSRQQYYHGSSIAHGSASKGLSDRAPEMVHEKSRHSPEHDGSQNYKGEKAPTKQRKERMKKQFMELARKVEDVLGADDDSSAQTNRIDPTGGDFLPKRDQNGVKRKNKPQIDILDQNDENQVIDELNTSNFSDENYLKDESLIIPGTTEMRDAEKDDEGEEERYPEHSPRENGVQDGRSNIPGNQGEYYDDEDFFEDEEAYRQNYRIVEAAAIFIQKNYRGYLARKQVGEYLENLYGMQQYEDPRMGHDAQYLQNPHGRRNEAVLREEDRLIQKYGQNISGSFEDKLDSGKKGSQDEERDIVHQGLRKQQGHGHQQEESDDEVGEYYEYYQQFNKNLQQNFEDNGEDDGYDSQDDFYSHLNQQLQGKNANQHHVSVNENEEDAHDKKYHVLKGGQKMNLLKLPGQQKPVQHVEYEDEDIDDEVSHELLHLGAKQPKRQLSDSDLRYSSEMANEEPLQKKPFEIKKKDNNTIKGKEDAGKSQSRDDRYHHDQSESEPGSGRDNVPQFMGNPDISQEKMVMTSIIQPDEEVLEDDSAAKKTKGTHHAPSKSQGKPLDDSKGRAKSDLEDTRQHARQQSDDASIGSYSAMKSNPQSNTKARSSDQGGLFVREINDNSKSLITVGEYDEAGRDLQSAEKMRSGMKTKTDTTILRENLIEEFQKAGQLDSAQKGETIEDFKKLNANDKKTAADQAQASPRDKQLLQKTFELTSIYQNELARVREEQAKKLADIIGQLSFLQSSDPELSAKAKHFIENLQKQLEDNKKMLQENLDMQRAVKTAHSTISNDQSLLNELEYLVKQTGTMNFNNTVMSIQNTLQTHQDFIREMGLSIPNANNTADGRKKAPLGKKANLQIDTEAINREQNEHEQQHSEGLEGMNMTEQMIREQSAATLSHAMNTPTPLGSRNKLKRFGQEDEFDMTGMQEPGSIFEKDPFKEFANQKFKELLHQENMLQMIKMREQALESRHKSHVEYMNKMLENKRVSPRTFHHKQMELEKWVTKEREQIQKSKRDIEKGWMSFADAIKRTKRDLEFMRKVKDEDKKNLFNDLNLRNSFTDEEGNFPSSKRLPFKSDGETGESDFERTQSQEKLPKGNFSYGVDFKTPGSSKNVINIIDKFEIKEDGGNTGQPEIKPHMTKVLPAQKSQKSTEKRHEQRGATDSEDYNPEDFGDESFEGSLQDTAVLKKRLKELNIESQDKEKDAEFEEQIKDLSVLQEELDPQKTHELDRKRQKFAPATHDERLIPDESLHEDLSTEHRYDQDGRQWAHDTITSPHGVSNEKVDQMRSSKGFAMNRYADTKPEEMSAEINEKLHEELREITEGSKNRSNLKSPDGGMTGMIDINAFESLENFDETNSAEGGSSNISIIASYFIVWCFLTGNSARAVYEHPISHEKDKVDQPEFPLQQTQEISTEDKVNRVTEAVMQHLMKELSGDKVLSSTISSRSNDSQSTNEVKLSFGDSSGKKTTIPASLDANDIFGPDNNLSNLPGNQEEDTVQSNKQKQPNNLKDSHIFDREMSLYKPYQHSEEDFVPGFPTGMDAVNDYLNLLCFTIKGTYKQEFLTNINIPLGLTPEEKLTNLHIYDPNQSEISIDLNRRPQRSVLSIDLYLQIEDRIKEKFMEKDEILLEMELFHNKGVFDAFNEALDYYRPYGLMGIPFSWKSSKIYRPREITEDLLDLVLEKTKEKVLIWSSFMCGYLGMGEDFYGDRMSAYHEDYMAQIKEEKLARLLAQEVYDTEERWLNYDDEETEVEIEISDLIFDKLAFETAELLLYIQERRSREKQILNLKATKLPKRIKFDEPKTLQEPQEDQGNLSL